MEKIILNETPKRTSKSFKINNIEIEKFELPQLKVVIVVTKKNYHNNYHNQNEINQD